MAFIFSATLRFRNVIYPHILFKEINHEGKNCRLITLNSFVKLFLIFVFEKLANFHYEIQIRYE